MELESPAALHPCSICRAPAETDARATPQPGKGIFPVPSR